jgi:alanyl-tRNA synthetase
VISADEESGKVVHVNFVSDKLKSRGLDARTWAAKVSEILGGKVSLATVKFPPLLKTP